MSAFAIVGPGLFCDPDTSTIRVRSNGSYGLWCRRSRKSGMYECGRPACTYGMVNPGRSFFAYAATSSASSHSNARIRSQVLPPFPSRVTWLTSDLVVAYTFLRVRNEMLAVEPVSSCRRIIGRSSSRRLPTWITTAFQIASTALDYFHDDGVPQFIECNPRITEPGNAAAAGVDLPRLMIALATGREPLPAQPLIATAGVRTRSTLAIALGAAELGARRCAILSAATKAVTRRVRLGASSEVLTPVLADPPSIIPAVVAMGTVLARPANTARLAADAVASYGVTPDAIARVRRRLST